MLPKEVFFLIELEHRAPEFRTVEETDSLGSHNELSLFACGCSGLFGGDQVFHVLKNSTYRWTFLTKKGQGGEQ